MLPAGGNVEAGELLEDAGVEDDLAETGEAEVEDGLGNGIGGAACGGGIGVAEDAGGQGGIELDQVDALVDGGLLGIDQGPEVLEGAVGSGQELSLGFEDGDELLAQGDAGGIAAGAGQEGIETDADVEVIPGANTADAVGDQPLPAPLGDHLTAPSAGERHILPACAAKRGKFCKGRVEEGMKGGEPLFRPKREGISSHLKQCRVSKFY